MESSPIYEQTFNRRTMLAGLLGAIGLSITSCASHEASETSEHPDRAPGGHDTSKEHYPTHRNVAATVFWIGEPADDSNDYISNVPTAWDSDATKRFGGADGPTTANGKATDVARNELGNVTSFTPRHNTYYYALPASEYDENGLIENAREQSPWHDETLGEGTSLFKGRWLKATNQAGDSAYGQWLDVGPNEEQDYEYVFGDGSQAPRNTFGEHAGLDVSPAMARTLGFDDGSAVVSWQFVDRQDVPDGPWLAYPEIDNKTYWE